MFLWITILHSDEDVIFTDVKSIYLDVITLLYDYPHYYYIYVFTKHSLKK